MNVLMQKHKKLLASGAALGVVVLGLVATWVLFVKPYDVPEFLEIDSSESAFLIPLEGDSTTQAAFQSVRLLEEKKVAAKRVQITHRWNQLGFIPSHGKWIPTVRLIKVDRRPVTREWTKSHQTGTSAKDEAISAESRDSVNFSMGVSCTASIPEESAALFLYSYPSKSLAEMMDMEVRARIMQVVSEEAGTYALAELPMKKNEIMKAVRADVMPFFKKKGIEISTLAVQGGLTFDNKDIQKAIDDAAKAGQLKVAAEAKRAAQEVENKTLLLAAEGKADAAKRDAQSKVEVEALRAEGEAKVKLLAANAEADVIRKLAEAKAQEAKLAGDQPDFYLRMRLIDAEVQRWKLWDGRYPSYLVQTGSGASPGLFLPPELPRLAAREEKPAVK